MTGLKYSSGDGIYGFAPESMNTFSRWIYTGAKYCAEISSVEIYRFSI